MSLQRLSRRKRRLATTAVAGASLLMVGSAVTRAQNATSADDTGALEAQLKNVDLVDTPLPIALRLVGQQTHVDYVLMPGDYRRVQVSISRKPVSEALKIIAQSAGAELWQEHGTYFIGPIGSAPHVVTPPLVATAQDNVAPPAQRVLKYEKFYLKYTPPKRMLRMLGLAPSDALDPDEQFEIASNRQFIEAMYPRPYFSSNGNSGGGITVLPYGAGPINPQVPNAGPQVGPSAPINGSNPLSNRANGGSLQPGGNNGGNSAAPGNNFGNNSGNNSGGNFGANGANGDQNANRDSRNFSEFGRGQGAFGGGGGLGQPGGTGGTGQNNAPGFGAAQGFLQGISSQDIFALDADNSLVLRYDDPVQIANLQQVLQVLDVKPRQIQIKAEFVTVTQNDVNSFGLNFNFTKVNLLAGANIGYQTANTAFVQYATGNLQAQLSFILTQGRGKVVASPLATTLNGVAANFTSQQLIPVILSGAVLTANGQSAVTSTIQTVPVTVQLNVTPRINGDDSITLFGQVVFSDVTGTITNPSGGTIPITITQPVTITRIVRNGDSMVIAGLTRKRDNVSTNKVPLLGDLPLIGTLFRSRNVTTDDSELVVFITPTIIPERPSSVGAGGGVGGGLAAPGAGGAGGLPPVGGALMP